MDCEKNKYQFASPKMIRVNESATSIEVKKIG